MSSPEPTPEAAPPKRVSAWDALRIVAAENRRVRLSVGKEYNDPRYARRLTASKR